MRQQVHMNGNTEQVVNRVADQVLVQHDRHEVAGALRTGSR